ncbi:MAG: TIGR01212 family radical SAM protein [Candidatus Omnitrophica bacterium]|nr:TIGR01212 family radical SAM protein [Candidatus Omnitrophota bacterium]MDD5430345.1 TIGR01212 family radical SAM protein [Candidatus Omnitrophota bacterium]
MEERFYSFSKYLKDKFGEKVQRLSLDAGFGCPNIDGSLSSKGCIYCNNRGFGRYARLNKPLKEQIKESIKFYENRRGIKKFIAYFQSFSNTYAGLSELKEKYDIIREFPRIVGLFVSTRPDCIDEPKMQLLSSYNKDYLVWVEYGLQTTHDRILKNINRNHSYKDFLSAVELTRKYNINVGVHLIFGLPLATCQDMLDDIQELSDLDIQGVKFHVLHVLSGTGLEKVYRRGKVKLLTKEEYVRLIVDSLKRLRPGCVILRLVSDASSNYLVAPDWINRKSEVIGNIRAELEKRKVYQGCLYEAGSAKS